MWSLSLELLFLQGCGIGIFFACQSGGHMPQGRPREAPDCLGKPLAGRPGGGLEGARYKEDSAKAPEGPGKPPAGRPGGCKVMIFHCFCFTLFSRFPWMLWLWLMSGVLGGAHAKPEVGIADPALIFMHFCMPREIPRRPARRRFAFFALFICVFALRK